MEKKYTASTNWFLTRIILILVFILPITLISQPRSISGLTINQTEVWSGVIQIEGDIVVSPTGILIIEPGTIISFAANSDKNKSGQDPTRCELIVQGVLLAKGDVNKKILFSSGAGAPRMGDWYGISIAGSRKGSEFDYCVIEYAYNGITIKKSNPNISNSHIRYNYHSGLMIEIKSSPKINSNIISENGYGGIVCRLASNPVLTDNMITLNQIGLIIFGNSRPNLGSMRRDDDYNIGRNSIIDNQEYNIHNHSSQEIKAENNSWGTADLTVIANQIFDSSDESKYGVVDYRPLLRSRQSIDRRMLSSQYSTTTSSSQVQSQTQQVASGQPSHLVSENLATTSSTNGNSQTNTAIDSSIEEIQENIISKIEPEVTPTLSANDIENSASATEGASSENEEVKAPVIDYEQIFLDAFLDQKKQITKKVAPSIENKERGMNAHGNVLVRVVVDRRGFVESANVLRGLNYYYDEISLEAARNFEFQPGTINEERVRFSTVLFFKF